MYFNSHIDGKRIFMVTEESMRIQSNLASTIAMAFDECIPNPSLENMLKNQWQEPPDGYIGVLRR